MIKSLGVSPNFESTHQIVRELDSFSDFSELQKEKIITAGLNNDQIYWISGDYDVKKFYKRIIKNSLEFISQKQRKEFEDKFFKINNEN